MYSTNEFENELVLYSMNNLRLYWFYSIRNLRFIAYFGNFDVTLLLSFCESNFKTGLVLHPMMSFMSV